MAVMVKNAGGGSGIKDITNSIIEEYCSYSDTVDINTFIEFVDATPHVDAPIYISSNSSAQGYRGSRRCYKKSDTRVIVASCCSYNSGKTPLNVQIFELEVTPEAITKIGGGTIYNVSYPSVSYTSLDLDYNEDLDCYLIVVGEEWAADGGGRSYLGRDTLLLVNSGLSLVASKTLTSNLSVTDRYREPGTAIVTKGNKAIAMVHHAKSIGTLYDVNITESAIGTVATTTLVNSGNDAYPGSATLCWKGDYIFGGYLQMYPSPMEAYAFGGKIINNVLTIGARLDLNFGHTQASDNGLYMDSIAIGENSFLLASYDSYYASSAEFRMAVITVNSDLSLTVEQTISESGSNSDYQIGSVELMYNNSEKVILVVINRFSGRSSAWRVYDVIGKRVSLRTSLNSTYPTKSEYYSIGEMERFPKGVFTDTNSRWCFYPCGFDKTIKPSTGAIHGVTKTICGEAKAGEVMVLNV